MQKTERLVAITLLLQTRGKMTARRLAEIFSVSPRTIYRDITALSLAHVPVSMEYGPGGGYYLPSDYHLESAIFTREEAVSLILSADVSGVTNLFAGDTDLQRALTKLEAVLPEEYLAEVASTRERILFDTASWSSPITRPTRLETLRSAVLGSRQLEITYPGTFCDGDNGPHPLRVRIEPLGLVFKGLKRRRLHVGRWYLIAFCLHCQCIHPFRMSTLQKIVLCKEENEPHCDFDLNRYWQKVRPELEQSGEPLHVQMRVSPGIRFGLPGNVAILAEEPDGSARISITFDTLNEAVAYALSLGAEAIVLDPPEVRDAVLVTAQALTQRYQHEQASCPGSCHFMTT